MVYVVIIVIGVLLWLKLKPYFIKYDTLVSFTGGLGSGKTFKSVETALTLYHRQRLKYALRNAFKKKADRKPLPELYTNIPVKISRNKYACRLKPEHLLLQERLNEGSVVLIDEVDGFANQFNYNNPCIVDTKGDGDNGNFDEFCRFFRHYTKGGFLVFNTQCTANENLTIRRRQNQIVTLFHFRTWGLPLLPKFLYTVKCRTLTVSDDVKTEITEDTQDAFRLHIGLLPLTRHYDTYCYSERYNSVPEGKTERHRGLKLNRYIRAPYGKQEKLTSDIDE